MLNDQLCSATLCQGWRGRLATFTPVNCVTSEVNQDAGGVLHITQKCMEVTTDSGHIISHLVVPPLFNHYLDVNHSRSPVTTAVLTSFGRLMRHFTATGSSSLMQLMWLIWYSGKSAPDLLQRGSTLSSQSVWLWLPSANPPFDIPSSPAPDSCFKHEDLDIRAYIQVSSPSDWRNAIFSPIPAISLETV